MLSILILIIALAAIIWGADMLVNGSVAIARRFHVSDFVIGAVIVGIGTSCPELVVSSYGALQGNVDVAIGNVVGSNIFNVLCILGLTALLWPITVSRDNLKFDLLICICVSMLAILLAFNFFNGQPIAIDRIDGLVFIIGFALYIYVSFLRDSKNHPAKRVTEQTEEVPKEKLLLSIVKVVVGLAILVTGCQFFVDEAEKIALMLGVDEAFISITLIACGTSLPELAASLTAAFKRNTQLALGNVVGSNIFNILFILGFSSQLSPLTGGGITVVDYTVMIAAVVLLFVVSLKGRISRMSGALMLASFIGYLYYLISLQ
ncbi:MAG: calcium/sodium antiporter [Alistipes sp.]|nr:calcium/sodium antiporter [Alistipes sp.]